MARGTARSRPLWGLLLLLLAARAPAGLPAGTRTSNPPASPRVPASEGGAGPGRVSRAAEALRDRGIPPLLATGLIAMVPVFELRGAIPAGIALFKIDVPTVFAVSVLFNLVPVLPVLLLLGPVRRFLERRGVFGRFFRFLDRKAERNRALIERYEEFGLALFVAVPLPVTGAWTGAVVASILGLRTLKSFLFISMGVVGAGGIVTLFTTLGHYGAAAASLLVLGAAAAYAAALLRARRLTGGR